MTEVLAEEIDFLFVPRELLREAYDGVFEDFRCETWLHSSVITKAVKAVFGTSEPVDPDKPRHSPEEL